MKNALSFTDLAAPLPALSDQLALNPLHHPLAPLGSSEEALNLALRVIAEQQRRIGELENEAHSDHLTGLLNKRGFERVLQREVERSQRSGKPSAILILFDLDGLKQVNDQHGHLTGDAYIAGLALELQGIVRTTDFVARLGGDEFALLMTDTDIEKGWIRALAMAERLNNRLVKFNDMRFPLRVSHGAAVLQPALSSQAVMAEADARLYERKAQRKKVN